MKQYLTISGYNLDHSIKESFPINKSPKKFHFKLFEIEREALDLIRAEEERLQQLKKEEQKRETERQALEYFAKLDFDQVNIKFKLVQPSNQKGQIIKLANQEKHL